MNSSDRRLSLEFRAEKSELPPVTAALDNFWQLQGFGLDLQSDLNIAVEEIVTNVIRHGAANGKPITLEATVSAEEVSIEIQDSGIPFNPLDHPLPDPTAPMEQRRPGGLGIFMVINLMTQTSYQRQNGRNCFTMKRTLPSKQEGQTTI